MWISLFDTVKEGRAGFGCVGFCEIRNGSTSCCDARTGLFLSASVRALLGRMLFVQGQTLVADLAEVSKSLAVADMGAERNKNDLE
jgi:hypothetical protein